MVAVLQIAALFALGADPVLTLPPELKGAVGAPIVIRAETDGKVVKFRAAAGLNIVDRALVNDAKVLIVSSGEAGRFVVDAWTAVGDVPSEIASVVVIVGDGKPVPPGPKPPSELVKSLEPIYGAIQGNDKQAGALLLAKTLREFAKREPAPANVAGYFVALKAALTEAKIPDVVQPLRSKLGNDMEALLGKTGSTPIVPEAAAAAAAKLTDYANALEQIARQP